LTGKPLFREDTLEMTADRFVVERAAGNMLASGAVQTTVRSSNHASAGGLLSGSQAMHVIARQVQVLHESQTAIFTGQARLWQGPDSVEAPVIELSQKMQTLRAYGRESCKQCVHTTFLGQSALGQFADPAQAGKPKATKNEGLSEDDGGRGPSSYRVLSQRLLYSDAERKATFSDRVEAISSSGDIRADHVEVFLTPATSRSQAKPGNGTSQITNKIPSHSNDSAQSSVERIVATGHVTVEQPGRHGTGTQLVYTASDGKFVLTGNGAHLPQVVDSIQGTVTGEVLTFSSQTQAIIVRGSSNTTAVTKTRVQKK
ncbi:MAG TPA: LptA/OstA family protein, partial [Acidobacteriaceae bacterium]|nr:LptA/OstA family protein [Acidobacteriaceae bacterium]